MIKFKTFSIKQIKVLSWWQPSSPYKDYNGIIADGSIRAGKTVAMAVSFIIWSMSAYNGMQFGMSGKSIGSFKRNVIFWLRPLLKLRGYSTVYKDDTLIVKKKVIDKETNQKVTIENYYYVFGGRDERSQDFIQGLTAAGWFFDEVALQPESFVNQAIGRCSVEGSKLFFNCNPDSPMHWFKTEFIDKADEKKLLHIHFIMADNPSLSKKKIKIYESMFSGVFYLRFILGLWVLAEGIIFDMVDDNNYYTEPLAEQLKLESARYISIDYGITNPMAFGNYYDKWEIIYKDDEYYYNSKEKGKQKSDPEYLEDLKKFIAKEPYPVEQIIIDPSATSFKVLLRNEGYRIKDADNEVLEGIKIMSSALHQNKLKINKNNCIMFQKEIGAYCWDTKARDRGLEKPIKENDHAMDESRYLINTIMKKRILRRV